MFEYSLYANDIPQVKVFQAETLNDVARITKSFKGKKTVLLLEMGEKGTNPESHIPMVVSVSTRDAYSKDNQ